MSTLKCKMCGGTIEFEQGATVCTCDYCGTKQTLPRLDDERKANLYDRANHFRRNNDYDKAMSIYEQILNEDSTDAESYWSIVLCKYGIEYVEDPATHKRVPTVNRAQFTSVVADEDYKNAIQYATVDQKIIYEEEAKAIDDIQKGILEISQKEEPFDVFICYKETDNDGRRTRDSVLATDLYHQLVQEGFKVFFSRITLEDKLGTAYEPYIFAALHSAKVMVVLGTKQEFFNAVWVKNEWSRYLALIRKGEKKMLIPAYRDMDPYDLPEEFSHLQAQDMSKLGFMQDLIRGIKKIAKAEEVKVVPVQQTVTANSSGANVTALLKRGFMALEDEEWDKADGFFEGVLNQDAECAEAYLGKLLAELCVRERKSLASCKTPFDKNKNYKKIVRFGDEILVSELNKYIEKINERNSDLSKNSVIFGTYKGMPIEWQVLKRENGRILVISRYALDCQPYNTSRADITWKTCSLRKWLNEIFLNAAFSEDERDMIPSVTVSADKNPYYDTSPGNSTTDKVFLLSLPEVNKYFSSDNARQCQVTEYCYAQSVYTHDGNCWWWLRTPGDSSSSATYIDEDGIDDDGGDCVTNDYIAVRPALWIKLRS